MNSNTIDATKCISCGKTVMSSYRRKHVTCSVCGKVLRDDHLKRHMSAKHAPLSVSVKPSMMKKCAIRSMKRKAIDVTEKACEEKSKTVSSNRHRMIACKVCKRVMHSNNSKRHMGAMHGPLTVDWTGLTMGPSKDIKVERTSTVVSWTALVEEVTFKANVC